MRIEDLFERQRPVFSFEFFPPKTDEGQQTLRHDRGPERRRARLRLGDLRRGRLHARPHGRVTAIKRDSASRRWRTSPASATAARRARRHTREDRAAGIENVLALRGDPPRGRPVRGRTRAACRTRELIRADPARCDFCVGGACYPEGHLEAPDRESDLRTLQDKVDAGARVPDHPALLRQRGLLRLRRARARGRHRRADRPRHHADHQLRQIERFTEHVRRDHPGRLERAARAGAPTTRKRLRARGGPRDRAVHRSPRARRARRPLLHAEPLAGNAGDPGRAARGSPLDAGRRPRSRARRGRAPPAASDRCLAVQASSPPRELQVAGSRAPR